MEDKKLEKQVTFRISEEEFQKLQEAVGPFGSVAPLLRQLVQKYLEQKKRTSKVA